MPRQFSPWAAPSSTTSAAEASSSGTVMIMAGLRVAVAQTMATRPPAARSAIAHIMSVVAGELLG